MLSKVILEINNLILLYKKTYLYSNLKTYSKENTNKLKMLYEKYQNSVYEIIKELNNLNIGVLSKKNKEILEHNYYTFKEYTRKFPLENTKISTEINKLNDKLEKYWNNYFIENKKKDFSGKFKKIVFCTGPSRVCPFFHILFFIFLIFLIALGCFFPDKIKNFKGFYMFLMTLDIIFLTILILVSFAEEEFKKNSVFLYFKYVKTFF